MEKLENKPLEQSEEAMAVQEAVAQQEPSLAPAEITDEMKEPEPKLYTEQEMAELTEAAYLRGRNEQIESHFVADTSQLAESDGRVSDTDPNTDGSWIHTRTSVWGT